MKNDHYITSTGTSDTKLILFYYDHIKNRLFTKEVTLHGVEPVEVSGEGFKGLAVKQDESLTGTILIKEKYNDHSN